MPTAMELPTVIFFFLLFLAFKSHARTVNISSKCDLDSDQTEIGRCLRPWLDLWEMIRVREEKVAKIVFPVPFYSRESVLLLCGAYVNSRDECLPSQVRERCRDNEMVTFVQSHMSHFCGNRAQLALGSFDCVRSALSSRKRCMRHIEGIPLPTHQAGKCSRMPDFFECVGPTVEDECGMDGLNVLVDAIVAFGCKLNRAVMDESFAYAAKLNTSGRYTEEAGKNYIRAELAAAIVLVDGGRKAFNPRKIKFDKEISMAELMAKYFARGKPSAEYRRSPSRKTSSLDYAESNTFLESDPTVEIAFGEDTQNPVQEHTSALTTDLECDDQKQSRLARCYAPLIKQWEEIHMRLGHLKDVLFPSFNYSVSDVFTICEVFEVALEKCLSPQLLTDCQHHGLVEMMDQQLGVICSHVSSSGFTKDYACLRNVLFSHQECFAFIPGRNVPGLSEDKKCKNMPGFYDCMRGHVLETCGEHSLTTFTSIITNYGCSLRNPTNESSVESTINNSSGSKTEDTNQEGTIESKSVAKKTSAVKILDGEMFSYTLSPDCSRDVHKTARDCTAPLIRTWTHMRQQRPELAQVSFPLYRYTRTELLELCDGYANMFLCAGFKAISSCLNDELVRFARDHLGFACNPQNIERFMRIYDCVVQIETHNADGCQQFIEGIAEPSQDQLKCRGMKQYQDCMKPNILKQCKQAAFVEFKQSIDEFGCSL